MKCPILSCGSTNVSSERKYKATTSTNRQKYEGMNVDRRRYVCNSCNRPFHTIELLEEEFEKSGHVPVIKEVGGRIR